MKKSCGSAKDLLNHCQQVFEKTSGKKYSGELNESIADNISPLRAFLKIDNFQVIIICYYVHTYITNKEIAFADIVKHFGNDMSILSEFNKCITRLLKKGLLLEKVTTGMQAEVLKSVVIHQRTLKALVHGKKKFLKQQPVNSILQFMEQIMFLIELRNERSITRETLCLEATCLFTANAKLPELKWLNSFNLKLLDKLIFWVVCFKTYGGEESTYLESVVEKVAVDENEKYRYLNQGKGSENELINKGLIQFERFDFATYDYVQLTAKSLNVIFQDAELKINKRFAPGKGTLIPHYKIITEQLFFNTEESRQIFVLQNILLEENYRNLCNRLQEKQLNKGFTILLHGLPGTGKTATVKQLAKKSGRDIFLVDTEKIKDRWVGDSERNIKMVFQEYDDARKNFERDPILLFNEADAILSRRININSSVDQMNNTMQNILLQQLEEFEGIFIATTNLSTNLDAAFNRRLLYKIEYKKPAPSVRLQILKHVFSEINPVFLEIINKKYNLSGGQIVNIKKKIVVEELLSPVIDINERLKIACEEEFRPLQILQNEPIGFLKNV